MAKRGAKTKYSKKIRDKIEVLARKGFTDVEISKMIDITEVTLHNWKKKYPDFFESLKSWKLIPDAEVERSLFERACGYEHPETKFHYDTTAGKWVSCDTTKHYAPDPTSMIFWLKNRKPDVWRDKKDLDLNDKTVRLNKKRFDGESENE